MSSGYFITGTDTEVGKTRVSVAMLHRLRQQGLRVAGMKPVSAGCEKTAEGLRNEDALALQAASSAALPYETLNPYAFAPPIAPHLAARDAGVTIEIGRILAAYQDIAAQVDSVVVEGAGGWRVPLNDDQDMSDLAAALGLPVLLVVDIRLGCINHALLSAQAIAARGLPLAGWIANHAHGDYARSADNIASIGARIGMPLLGMMPYQGDITADLMAELNWR
ncbi:MAG: dethiobiotin synthase [Gammaproteobacteria bacterium]|nr:dethiobiotin synthase [Gammaproteobacteria bacterium]